MRLSHPAATLFYSSLTLASIASISYAFSNPKQPQHPLANMNTQSDPPTIATASSPLLLSDTLATQRSLSLFSSLTRDSPVTNSLFSSNSGYTIVLAPVNTAMKSMSHRPWENEGGESDETARLGGDGLKKANENLEKWVRGYLVSGDKGKGWAKGEKRVRGQGGKDGGKEVWWEVDGQGKVVVMPEGVVVREVVSRAANGEVWALEGTLEK